MWKLTTRSRNHFIWPLCLSLFVIWYNMIQRRWLVFWISGFVPSSSSDCDGYLGILGKLISLSLVLIELMEALLFFFTFLGTMWWPVFLSASTLYRSFEIVIIIYKTDFQIVQKFSVMHYVEGCFLLVGKLSIL